MKYQLVNVSDYNNGKVIMSSYSKTRLTLLADNIADCFPEVSLAVYANREDENELSEVYFIETKRLRFVGSKQPNTIDS